MRFLRSHPTAAGAGVFALALALRLALALALPSDDTVFGDAPFREYAQNIAEGRGFWMGNPYGPELGMDRAYAFRPPLFPLLWGCVYRVTGGAYAPIRVAHAVLGALACVLAMLAAMEWTGRRGIGVLTGILCAVYPALIWHSVHLMSEPLFLFTSATCLLALLRFHRTARLRWLLLAGAAAGLAALSRSVLAGFLPAAAVWILWARRTRPHRWRDAVLFAATAGIVILPWTIRNAIVLGRFVPLTTDAGHGFYVANNARAAEDARGFWIPDDWSFLLRPGEERLDEVTAYQRLMRLTARYLWENPKTAARLMVRRFKTFWSFYPNPQFVRGRAQVAVYAASYLPVFALMLPGVWLVHRRAGRRRAACVLVDVYVAYTTAIHVVFLAMLRYREPLMLFLLGFTAATVWTICRSVRRRRRQGAPS